MNGYDDDLYDLDKKNVDKVATKLALHCLPGHRTPEYEKDRIYWEALQIAWLTPGVPRGAAMLKELKALTRLGQIEYEIEAAAAIIYKYHALTFPEPK